MHKLSPVFERVKQDLLRARAGSCIHVCIMLSNYGENKVFGWDSIEPAKDFIRLKLGGVGYSIENSFRRLGIPRNLNAELLECSFQKPHGYMTAREWDEWRKWRIMWVNSLIADLNSQPLYVPVWPPLKVKDEVPNTNK